MNSLIVGETGMTSQCQVNGKLGQQLVSFSIWLSNKYHVNILLIYRPLCRNSFGLRFKKRIVKSFILHFFTKKKVACRHVATNSMVMPTTLKSIVASFCNGKDKAWFLVWGWLSAVRSEDYFLLFHWDKRASSALNYRSLVKHEVWIERGNSSIIIQRHIGIPLWFSVRDSELNRPL